MREPQHFTTDWQERIDEAAIYAEIHPYTLLRLRKEALGEYPVLPATRMGR